MSQDRISKNAIKIMLVTNAAVDDKNQHLQ